MKVMPPMVDMKRTPAEAQAQQIETATPPEYPYGLCISFGNEEMEKLGLDDDVQVGDMLHMHCMAKVTSVSSHDHETSGKHCRIELQITHIQAEDEEAENKEAEEKMPVAKRRTPRLYE